MVSWPKINNQYSFCFWTQNIALEVHQLLLLLVAGADPTLPAASTRLLQCCTGHTYCRFWNVSQHVGNYYLPGDTGMLVIKSLQKLHEPESLFKTISLPLHPSLHIQYDLTVPLESHPGLKLRCKEPQCCGIWSAVSSSYDGRQWDLSTPHRKHWIPGYGRSVEDFIASCNTRLTGGEVNR